MDFKEFNSIRDLIRAFPTERSCIKYLTKIRWKGNVVSPFDPESKVYKCKNNRYRCKNTGKYFNVKTNTIFDNTKLPLIDWFLAIWLATGHRKGISSVQLSRELNITQKSAWFMLSRIRQSYDNEPDLMLKDEVEVDETLVGGKNKNRHSNKKIRGNREDKSPVVGMVQRNGKIVAKVVEDRKIGTITKIVVSNVEKGTKVYTDEFKSYNKLKRIYDHKHVKHKSNIYVEGEVHTNTIESFWSILKRGLVGVYHFASRKHLQIYVDEFVFRYNTRRLSEPMRFNLLLENMENRVTYQELTNGKKE